MTESDRPRPRPRQDGAPAGGEDVARHAAEDVRAGGIPTGGIAIALPPTLPGGPGRPRPTGVRKWTRSTRRFLRTKRGKWTLASVIAVIALIVGLLSKGFLSDPADPLPDAPPAAGGATSSLDSVAPTASPSASARPTGPATAEDIKKELQSRAGQLNNPLNRLRSPGVHTVRVTVTSSGSVNSVGYLIPTSINTNNAYGTRKVGGSSFGISTKAVGSGYLALVFIQSGATGAPVTCRVTIDGRTTNSETTEGPYGRQVCLG